jgi:hypothetical protein
MKLTKIGVAEAQIRAAVRMFFEGWHPWGFFVGMGARRCGIYSTGHDVMLTRDRDGSVAHRVLFRPAGQSVSRGELAAALGPKRNRRTLRFGFHLLESAAVCATSGEANEDRASPRFHSSVWLQPHRTSTGCEPASTGATPAIWFLRSTINCSLAPSAPACPGMYDATWPESGEASLAARP